jgi:putative MATE family efflux protein
MICANQRFFLRPSARRNNKVHLRTTITYKNIWKIALPIIVGQVAQNIMVAIDTAFLGRVSDVALGASALGGLFYLAVVMLGIGFGSGIQILIGRRNGEKEFAQIGKLTDQSFYFLQFLAVFLFLILFFASPFLLKFFINSNDVYLGTIEFLKFRSWGIFFAFANIIFVSFYVGTVRTKILTYSTIICAVTNAVLDYFLIFGHNGFPEMGIGGAGFASATAEVLTFVFFLYWTYRFEDKKTFLLFRFSKFEFEALKKILKISGPLMLQTFFSFSGWFIFFMIIEHLGEQALAVSNICRSIYMLMMIPLWGLCSACNTLVSNLIGEKRHDEVIPLIRKISVISLLITSGIVIFNLIMPRQIIMIYTNDIALVNEAVNVLYVISVALVFFSVAIVLFFGVSGTGNTRITFMFEIFTITAYLIIAYVLAIVFVVPVHYVWIVECFYFLVIGLLSFIYLRTGKWRFTKI